MYDRVAGPLERGRERAIDRLDPGPDARVPIPGCGPGVDLEHLPTGTSVSAVDIAPAMVRRASARADALGGEVDARVGDAGALPFEDDAFDAVLLHLVLSVVPDPDAVVAETARVLAPEGRVSVFDKFAPEGAVPSLLRRAVNPLARSLFSDLNRRLVPMFAGTGLRLGDREPFLGGLYTATIDRQAADWAEPAERRHETDAR